MLENNTPSHGLFCSRGNPLMFHHLKTREPLIGHVTLFRSSQRFVYFLKQAGRAVVGHFSGEVHLYKLNHDIFEMQLLM